MHRRSGESRLPTPRDRIAIGCPAAITKSFCEKSRHSPYLVLTAAVTVTAALTTSLDGGVPMLFNRHRRVHGARTPAFLKRLDLICKNHRVHQLALRDGGDRRVV